MERTGEEGKERGRVEGVLGGVRRGGEGSERVIGRGREGRSGDNGGGVELGGVGREARKGGVRE